MPESEVRLKTHHLSEDSRVHDEDDLSKVKELSHKLQLAIRRRSVLQWKNSVEQLRFNGLFSNKEVIEKSLETIVEDANNCKTGNAGKLLQVDCKVEESDKTYTDSACKPNIEDTDAPNPEIESNKHCCSNQMKPVHSSEVVSAADKGASETERYRRISEALANVRKDLILMRMEDHSLARKLLNIREALNHQRATQICDEHAVMLDDFSWEIEEEEELNEKFKVSDLSSALVRKPDSLLRSSSLLRHMGISKMSMEFRRFSVI